MPDVREWFEVLQDELERFAEDTGLHPFGYIIDGQRVMMVVEPVVARCWTQGLAVDPELSLMTIPYEDPLEALLTLRGLLGVDREAGEA